jgi:hypothetical protein
MRGICRGKLSSISAKTCSLSVNGTLVGGSIGLILWLFSQIPTLFLH